MNKQTKIKDRTTLNKEQEEPNTKGTNELYKNQRN